MRPFDPRRFTQVMGAGLALLSLAVFFFSFALPDNEAWPIDGKDHQSKQETTPSPKPDQGSGMPLPVPPVTPDLPQGDDYAAAYQRSSLTGRELLVLFEADWCGPCKTVYSEHSAALRKRGELAVVNVDRDRELYAQMCPDGGLIPRMQVYSPVRAGIPRLKDDLTGGDKIAAFCALKASDKQPAHEDQAAAPTACDSCPRRRPAK